ncbi:hypothetical protein LVJ77_11645 [Conchiformibius kuhniae]|uniref:Uncharacterized protein n=1 Tax=Conchiformibius kuhniae TaxID=211502 RepID=A0A8T9MT52_9NEIS|nr:hypothetical protein LVJ77_11645 [Conchiformibius kuhniae]
MSSINQKTPSRHARECGNPLPDAWQAMFYQRLSRFDPDSCGAGMTVLRFFG